MEISKREPTQCEGFGQLKMMTFTWVSKRLQRQQKQLQQQQHRQQPILQRDRQHLHGKELVSKAVLIAHINTLHSDKQGKAHKFLRAKAPLIVSSLNRLLVCLSLAGSGQELCPPFQESHITQIYLHSLLSSLPCKLVGSWCLVVESGADGLSTSCPVLSAAAVAEVGAGAGPGAGTGAGARAGAGGPGAGAGAGEQADVEEEMETLTEDEEVAEDEEVEEEDEEEVEEEEDAEEEEMEMEDETEEEDEGHSAVEDALVRNFDLQHGLK